MKLIATQTFHWANEPNKMLSSRYFMVQMVLGRCLGSFSIILQVMLNIQLFPHFIGLQHPKMGQSYKYIYSVNISLWHETFPLWLDFFSSWTVYLILLKLIIHYIINYLITGSLTFHSMLNGSGRQILCGNCFKSHYIHFFHSLSASKCDCFFLINLQPFGIWPWKTGWKTKLMWP